jgi:hypothetical protein
MFVATHADVLNQIISGLEKHDGTIELSADQDFAVNLRDTLGIHQDVDPGVVCRLMKDHTMHGRVKVEKLQRKVPVSGSGPEPHLLIKRYKRYTLLSDKA